jgi:hypothetical protein
MTLDSSAMLPTFVISVSCVVVLVCRALLAAGVLDLECPSAGFFSLSFRQ